MSGLGVSVRLNRIFAHPSEKFFSIAVDHFLGYPRTLQDGLADLPGMIGTLLEANPDAMTMWAGAARTIWEPHAGRTPLIIQTGLFTPDDRVLEQLGTPEDAIRLGADAIAVAIGVRGPQEGTYLKLLERTVAAADRWSLPVIAHIYPRVYDGPEPTIVTYPDEIAWATRCGIECGVDVIKVAYTGDRNSFSQIVATSPCPIVVAGGLRTSSQVDALTTAVDSLACGAKGLTVGRNIWGQPDPLAMARAFAAVIHDGVAPAEALNA